MRAGEGDPNKAKETFGKTKEGTRGNKTAWFAVEVKRKKEHYNLWQNSRAYEHLSAYRKLKRQP